jgi:exportin-7
VTNKSQRLNFDISSANGILIFRETSEILNYYGNRILSAPLPADRRPEIYKIFRVCFDVLKSTLSGRYVAFGVFRIYGDSSLDSAFHTFFRMLSCVPVQDLLVSINASFNAHNNRAGISKT